MIMTKREPLMTDEHFNENIDFSMNYIEEDRKKLKNSHGYLTNPARIRVRVFKNIRQLFILKYSRGYSLGELKSDFLSIIEAWENLTIEDVEKTYQYS
jgi:hypothetical protein